MPRKPRLFLPGVPVHVVQRGNNRQAVFCDEADYRAYLGRLEEGAKRYGCAVHAYVERLNRAYREELLDQYLFARLDDVREATYWWMREYNEDRPHDSLGDCTPAEARQQGVGNFAIEVLNCRLDGEA
jgi:hypothetical protein